MADKEQCVRVFSAFLSQSAQEMENVLCKLKWKKEHMTKKVNSSKVVHCPINPNHRIPTSRLEKHLNACQYSSKGIRPEDVCSSPEFFYQSSSAVIPIFIHVDEKQHNSFKNGSERHELNQEIHDSSNRKGSPMCCASYKSLEERQAASSNQNISSSGTTMSSDLKDVIRSIMFWEVVPASHRQLDLHLLSQDKIKTWIITNLPQVQYLSSVEGASHRLVSFVLSCLQEENVANPSGMEEMLKDLLGEETWTFVLNLWKFLSVSVATEKSNTNQIQNLQADSSQSTTDLHESKPVESYVKEIHLPMERVITELSPQQRLAVYEHVIQSSKAKREEQKEDVDFEVAADSNDPKGRVLVQKLPYGNEFDLHENELEGSEDDQPKSHIELLAEQRDYKRRRQSYRAKNVHITKRSTVEVMRDLIETQMNVLEMQYKEEHGITGNTSDKEEITQERRVSMDQKDNTRRDSRDEEGKWRTERDRKQHREGNKRVRYHEDRDTDSKRSRR